MRVYLTSLDDQSRTWEGQVISQYFPVLRTSGYIHKISLGLTTINIYLFYLARDKVQKEKELLTLWIQSHIAF